MGFKRLLSLMFFLSITVVGSAQCAMCKAVVENGDNSMAEGLNGGILYLMAFPYLLVGVLVYFLIKKHRTKKNAEG